MADGSTKYGFTWGPMEVSRICGDDKFGRVLRIETPSEVLELRVTPKGFIRVGTVTPVKKSRPLPGGVET